MTRAHLTLIAAAALATSGAARADEPELDDYKIMVRICQEQMHEVTACADSVVRVTQEHRTETGDLNMTLRTKRRVAHCTIRPDLVIAGFDLMN